MTVAHPSVATLAPPSRERTRISHGKAAVSTDRQARVGALASTVAIGHRPLQGAAPAPGVSAQAHARHVARARIGLTVTSILLRTLVAVALAVGMYLVIANGVIAAAGESFASWYAGSVAPHMAVEFVPSSVVDVAPLGAAATVPEMLRPAG